MFLKTHLLASSSSYGAAETILAQRCMRNAYMESTNAGRAFAQTQGLRWGNSLGEPSLCSYELVHA